MAPTPAVAVQKQPTVVPRRSAADGLELNPEAALRRLGTKPMRRDASDDEILGLGSAASDSANPSLDAQLTFDFDEPASLDRSRAGGKDGVTEADRHESAAKVGSREVARIERESVEAMLEAHPELLRDQEEASAYRQSFATPEEAKQASAVLADLNRMDALFYSRRPEDHAELARSIAKLDPSAFASLAQAMASEAAGLSNGLRAADASRPQPQRPSASRAGVERQNAAAQTDASSPQTALSSAEAAHTSSGPTPAQSEFFQATNAAAVHTVLEAIESQVERLLPDGISKNARNRVVGEIYRELDGTLQSSRQLSAQMRDAFRAGNLDEEHQRAIVSLIAGRARQALPGVAKRVLHEWTSTVVAANQDRRTRQRAAERRVDIAGSGGAGESHRSTTPRDIDYKRMSDADILNL